MAEGVFSQEQVTEGETKHENSTFRKKRMAADKAHWTQPVCTKRLHSAVQKNTGKKAWWRERGVSGKVADYGSLQDEKNCMSTTPFLSEDGWW